jgi:hypothetical protein
MWSKGICAIHPRAVGIICLLSLVWIGCIGTDIMRKNGIRDAWLHHGSNTSMPLVTYAASPLEDAWSQNITAFDNLDGFCNQAERFRVLAYEWIDAVLENAAGKVHAELDHNIFSALTYTYTCGSKPCLTYTRPIEPLAFALRHPLAVCFGADLVDPEYVVLATKAEIEEQRARSPCIRRSCQTIMIYLGDAGVWHPNALGEVGQAWFENAYKSRDIEFNRILLWDSQQVTDADIFKYLPPKLWHTYQYYNLPATFDADNLTSPFHIIKTIAQRGDFVVLRLAGAGDYKRTDALIETLLADDELVGLVDELFYEDRVDFEPLSAYWNGSSHPHKRINASYEFFAKLRSRGVRAHAFV